MLSDACFANDFGKGVVDREKRDEADKNLDVITDT